MSYWGQAGDVSFTSWVLTLVIMLENSMLTWLIGDVLLKNPEGIMWIYTTHGSYANLPKSKTLYTSKSVVSSFQLKTFGNSFS